MNWTETTLKEPEVSVEARPHPSPLPRGEGGRCDAFVEFLSSGCIRRFPGGRGKDSRQSETHDIKQTQQNHLALFEGAKPLGGSSVVGSLERLDVVRPHPGPMGGAPSACESVSQEGVGRLRDWQTQARHESVSQEELCASRNVVPQERGKRSALSGNAGPVGCSRFRFVNQYGGDCNGGATISQNGEFFHPLPGGEGWGEGVRFSN
jgi:hypothetical protein